MNRLETRIKEHVFIRKLRLRFHCLKPLNKNTQRGWNGDGSYIIDFMLLNSKSMGRNFHRLSIAFKLHNRWQDYYKRILTLKCSQELSRILVLKTVWMYAKHVLYVIILLRTLQAGTENTNPPFQAVQEKPRFFYAVFLCLAFNEKKLTL